MLAFLCADAQAQPATFPNSFVGKWKGKLQWIRAGKPTQEFTMQLNIYPLDSVGMYNWHIMYGDSAKDSRPYVLKIVDIANGHWVIDEKDGIVLDSYHFGNCLSGAFTVNDNTIVDNYCVEDGKMKVEFFSIKLGDKTESGKGTEDVPKVISYRIGSYQTGVLTKIN